MKTVLILGGSYFCGRVFVERLWRLGKINIHVFNRGHLPIGLPNISEHRGDREIADDISENIPDMHWDAVVDFCGYNADHMNVFFDNLKGSVKHYIFVSTTTVYKDNSEVPLKENAATVKAPQYDLGDFADYGFNKVLAERALIQRCQNSNTAYTILRPAIVYGRYNYVPRESTFFEKIIESKTIVIPENSNARYSFLWVDDMADIIALAINNPNVYGKVYNLAGPETVAYTDFIEILKFVSKENFEAFEFSIDQIMMEQIPLPFPPDENLLYDGKAIQTDIEFAYTALRTGMLHTWNHYKTFYDKKRNQS